MAMNRFSFFLILAIAILAPTGARSAQTASMALLHHATDPNPGLQSYTASAVLSATLHAVLPVHKTFNGTVYYLKPKRKIEFQNVSGPLARFKELASSVPTFGELQSEYTVTPLNDTGALSYYSLVPKKTGSRVKTVELRVDDTTGLIQHVGWSYTNGGSLQLDQVYTTVGTFRLPVTTNISARFPGYSVNGTISFSNYRPNAPVSPSVFASPSPAPQ
jgi:hypothetical protein